LFSGRKPDARDAEAMHLRLLARRDLALDPDEALLGAELVAQLAGVEIGQTAVSSSTASSLSMMLRGSANTETVFTSVASTSPLRSTMSGRAAEITDAATRRTSLTFRS
jgi:hypothetical protein